jgi:hypothetical protein
MKTKYVDLIEHTYDCHQPEFQLDDNELKLHDI